MANPEHVKILKQGVEVWNKWREDNPGVIPDLSGWDLRNIDLSQANLYATNLRGVLLVNHMFPGTNLQKSELSDSLLFRVNFFRARLVGVNLSKSFLEQTNFSMTSLTSVELTDSTLSNTIFGDTKLSKTEGLDTCVHLSPSIIDDKTLIKSGPLPLSFLRGCGLSDEVIEFYQTLWTKPIQYYTCFISHSSYDQEFAEKLHTDLQNKGIRTWYAPENLKIGDRFKDEINWAIMMHDKLMLILSANSVNSEWVADEVERGLAREKKENKQVLFPIRIDDAVMHLNFNWVSALRRNRHIGDFTGWKNHDKYQNAFKRLLRDIKVGERKTS